MAKKAYSLDYSIERDTDRCTAIQEILNSLDKDPNQRDLEQMADYILYGKDENGKNANQRNETYEQSKRYNSYKTSDDKVISLDELIENPLFDQQQLRSAYSRDCYTKAVRTISRPKYNKAGELIDPGDSDIPGMKDLWESIDRLDNWIKQLKGEAPATESTLLFDDSYRLYRLKHTLIDMRKHQYYLKDAYKPVLHFMNIDHPHTQYYDWSGDAFYWISYEEWNKRVNSSYTTRVSKNLKDYETRGEGDTLEVKWMICEHHFDWENYMHVRILMSYLDSLKEQLGTKLDTYGITFLWDFERYRKLSNFSELREFLIDCKINKLSYAEIQEEMLAQYGYSYNENHLSSILANEVPKKIASTATKLRILSETPPEDCKPCAQCGRMIPLHPLFYSRNNARIDGFAITCKECERKLRVEKGGFSKNDRRYKDPEMSQMQKRLIP